jgi:hypothetical protein
MTKIDIINFYDPIERKSFYSLNGIFEVDNIEDFTKSLQESLTQFAKEYKEKYENGEN